MVPNLYYWYSNQDYIVIPKHRMEYLGTFCMLLSIEIEILSDKLLSFLPAGEGFKLNCGGCFTHP